MNAGAAQASGNSLTLPQVGVGVSAGPGALANGGVAGDAGSVRPDVSIVIPDRRMAEALSDALKNSGFRLPREFGNLRIIAGNPSMPATTGTSIPLQVGDLHSLQTLLANPAVLAEAILGQNHTELPPALTNLLQGSHTVFPGPQGSHAEAPLLGLQRFFAATTTLSAPRPEVVVPSGERTLPVFADRGSAAVSQPSVQPQASANVPAAKVPEVVRDVLVKLQILPAGVSTEQALPRFAEVMRLWTGAAQHSDLPADVVRVVSQFFASAALAMATASPQVGSMPLRLGQSPEAQRGLPQGVAGANGHPLFGESARPGLRFGNLTRGDIASAVMAALTGSPTLMPSAQPGRSALPGTAGEGQQNTSLLPGTNGQYTAVRGDKDVAAGRMIEGARADVGLDRSVRDVKTAQTRLTGDEGRERAVTEDVDLKNRRSAHDQESHHAGGDQETASELIETLWADLHTALQRGGFVEAGTLRRLMDAIEARSFLRVLAARVPDGMDLIDIVTLVDNRIGLSPESSGVNAALRRLADHRSRGRKDKSEILLEPLRDAFVVMDMIEADLMPVQESELSAEDLKGFETIASVAQMTLEHPEWIARTGMTLEDQRDLERLVGDIDRLVENTHERFEQLSIPGVDTNGPEYFRDTVPALPH